MISILMAAKTSTEYMHHAIASVIAQTYTDWELLICFNGDYVEKGVWIAENWYEHIDGNITVVRAPEIRTKGAALNHSVSLATGDPIAILDVDDLWHPLKLERQIQSLYSTSHPKDVLGTAADYFRDVSGSIAVPNGPIDFARTLRGNPLVNSSVIMRREFARWPERPEPVEDYELWLQLSRDGRVLWNMPDVFTFIRCHPTRWSHGLDPDVVRELQEKYRA